MNIGEGTGRRVFPPLPVGTGKRTGRPLRVCIASPDFVGPVKNGGIGTAYTSMADVLSEAGHDVTCLYGNGSEAASQSIEYWIKDYASRGISLVPLPELSVPLEASGPAIRSFQAFEWLRANDTFDVIHFPEWLGLGYYTLLAKKQGLAFQETRICVGIHSMTAWLKEGAREHLEDIVELQLDHMERQSVALADVVVSPSQYLLGWIADRGWSLPDDAFVQQYLMPKAARGGTTIDAAGRDVEEIVFFGRLETRKGIVVFCDALDRLESTVAAKIKRVTFLGKDSTVGSVKASSYLQQRAKRWTWEVNLVTDKNQPDAVAYLRGAGRLAVIASQLENSPLTVYECLGLGIPFIASRVGGIPELIAAEDVARVCYRNRPADLAVKIAEMVRQGLRPARAAKCATENVREWVAWHEEQYRSGNDGVKIVKDTTWPKVSLCLTTFNRPGLLSQALESIISITYPNLEVVLVDDGSTQEEALRYLDQLEPQFQQRNWKIVRQENRYLGAARNAGARNAAGEFLLFMDDDNYAEPHEVETLVKVALHTEADIVSCGMNYFSGEDAPDRTRPPARRWLPLGAAPAVGPFSNCFGDANSLVRRSCFERVGGFTEDYGVTHEDWEFLARAALSGFRMQLVPEFLFWYRVSGDSMLRTLDPYPNQMRSIRPFVESVPPELSNLVYFAQGLYLRYIKSMNQLSPFAQATIQWRSKLEAARALVGTNQPSLGLKLMFEGIKAAEASRNPVIILEALIETGGTMKPIDAIKAHALLDIAAKIAADTKNKRATERIAELKRTKIEVRNSSMKPSFAQSGAPKKAAVAVA